MVRQIRNEDTKRGWRVCRTMLASETSNNFSGVQIFRVCTDMDWFLLNALHFWREELQLRLWV